MTVRSEDKGAFDPDVMHNYATEVATNYHETESECVAGID